MSLEEKVLLLTLLLRKKRQQRRRERLWAHPITSARLTEGANKANKMSDHRKCCAMFCKNTPINSSRHFFKVPHHESEKIKWLELIGQIHLMKFKSLFLCDKHFAKSDLNFDRNRIIARNGKPKKITFKGRKDCHVVVKCKKKDFDSQTFKNGITEDLNKGAFSHTSDMVTDVIKTEVKTETYEEDFEFSDELRCLENNGIGDFLINKDASTSCHLNDPLGITQLEEKELSTIRAKASTPDKVRTEENGRNQEELAILNVLSDDSNGEKEAAKSLAMPASLQQKEPIVRTEPTHPLDGKLMRLITQPLNIVGITTCVAVQCRTIRIGSYQVLPTKKVIFIGGGIQLVVPPINPVSDGSLVSIFIPADKIFKIFAHFGAAVSIFFLYVKPQLAACVRYALGLNDPTKQFFDPCSTDQCSKRITIASEKLNDHRRQHMMTIYKNLYRVTNTGVKVPMLEEISQPEAEALFTVSNSDSFSSLTSLGN